MPNNQAFEDVEMKDDQDQKVLVAIKKQRQVSTLEGLQYSLLREIKLL